MRYITIIFCFLLVSCLPQQRLEPAVLVLGSWYGFYPIYYAQELGLDKQNGLQLKVLEFTNIGNLRRSYLREQVDFAATSTFEFTNAVAFSELNLRPVFFTDYSNGGDVIVATKQISDVDELYGKKIAVPSKGIGEFILTLVFESKQPRQYFDHVNIFETRCGLAFKEGRIDACVTYPPLSTNLLKQGDLHQIYSSKEHPFQILDMVWAKPDVPEQTREKLRQTWFAAVKSIQKDPDKFYQFVATITDNSQESIEAAMKGIQLLGVKNDKEIMLNTANYTDRFIAACELIGQENCEKYKDAFTW